MRVLFLCLGNICRSPLAEGAFRALVERRGLSAHIQADSAGTGGWHVGESPDPRSVEEARRHGVDISGQRARKLEVEDFRRFDWIVAMDRSNFANAQSLRPSDGVARVVDLMSFVPESPVRDVPDPYYGGPDGFATVWGLLEAGMEPLLEAVLGDAKG